MLMVEPLTEMDIPPVPLRLDVAGADTWMEPLLYPIVMAPSALNDMALWLSDVELFCVVLPSANKPTVEICVATDAVMVEPASPNVTPFRLEKLVAPGTVYEAVTIELFDIPKLMPLLLENTTVPPLVDCVPADIAAPPPPPAPPLMTTEPLLIPTDTPPAPANDREPTLSVPLDDCVVLLTAKPAMLVVPGDDTMNDPAEKPTEMTPAPTMLKERASMLLELDCPVVWLEANRPIL